MRLGLNEEGLLVHVSNYILPFWTRLIQSFLFPKQILRAVETQGNMAE